MMAVAGAAFGVIALGGFAARHYRSSTPSTGVQQPVATTAAPAAVDPFAAQRADMPIGAAAVDDAQGKEKAPVAAVPAGAAETNDPQKAKLAAAAPAASGSGRPSAAAPVTRSTGWLTVSAPDTMRIVEGGNQVGTSDGRLSLPEGHHELELVNDTSGFRVSHTVKVVAGKTASISVEFPKVAVALNAAPWADVWIDGERIGQTPVGNFPLTVGTHELLFRHPDLGEQRQVVTVTLGGPVRFSADLTRK
jgi:hypothetical protein